MICKRVYFKDKGLDGEWKITCMAMHEDEDVDVYFLFKNFYVKLISLTLLTTMIKETKAWEWVAIRTGKDLFAGLEKEKLVKATRTG